VHVAGWHEYPKYTYDYARLGVAGAMPTASSSMPGIEPPQVSPKFLG